MKKSIILLMLAACGAAFANEVGDDPAKNPSFIGKLTRAEVKAELMAAKQSGTLSTSEYTSNQPASFKAERSRADAHAEAVHTAHSHAIGEQY